MIKRKIKDIAQLNLETFRKNNFPEIIKYLDTGNLTKNKIEDFKIINTLKDKVPSRAQRKIRKNTILYSTVRPNQEHYGFVNDFSQDIVVSTGFTTIDVFDKTIYPKYLYFLLIQKHITDYLHLLGTNSVSSYPSISPNDLANLKFKFPKLDDQKKIADTLSNLNNKIEINNKINQELEAMAKLVYDYWFVQFDFPISASYAAAVGKPELEGKPYKASGGQLVYNEELKREIPEGWGNDKLSQLAFIKAGGDKPRNYTNEETEDNSIPIFSNGIKNEGLYGFTDKAIIDEPSLTVSARGTIGFCVLRRKPFVPIIRLIVLTPNSQNRLKFLHEYLKELDFENSGSVQQQLTVPQISNVNVLNPPNSILDDFSKLTNSFIRKIDLIKEENQELASLRDWLLPMLMNGQVSVGEGYAKVGEVEDGGGGRK